MGVPMAGKSRLSPTKIWPWSAPGGGTESGIAELRLAVSEELLDRLSAVGPPTAVLLAAHAKVVSALSAESEVLTGVLGASAGGTDRPDAALVDVGDGTWRELVAASAAALAAGAPGPDDDPSEPVFEAVLDLRGFGPRPAAPGGPVADDAVLYVTFVPSGDGTHGELVVRHRREIHDADHGARIAHYHLRALEHLAAAPDTPHRAATLLDEDELHRQLHEHSGPDRPLPPELFVELFEKRVSGAPDDLAAAHRGESWTYGELNARANRVAHALLAAGLRTEDPVAVSMERELDWIAAMLGVFKAGGAYLPVRPDFPADRIGTQLGRAGCSFALSKTGSDASVSEAVRTGDRPCALLRMEEIEAAGHPSTDPRVELAPDGLAYIYFTSGSTGEPKGAMCEHAGMLNHLFMKLDDIELEPGDVVTQTASQCFDISLWQVASPLLVGGSTRIIDTERQLDVASFVAELAEGGVQAIQVVPAYLDVMVSHLTQHPVDLADLRTVSVTGEALKLELVRRWFALYPGIRLVNAYGATEVSDDTMHEVLSEVPVRDFVSVGRSLRNVHTYVLDRDLRLAPLGAPGEIAFSGVAVGRGYINDPERTAAAFVEDPYRPGTRMYRTGDFGRWLPEGRIEFLGRRDEQVKIRGFRIEIGDIENKLLRMPGVREAAVVIEGAEGRDRNLVAFYNGADTLRGEEISAFLGTLLPDYMVPTYFHRLDPLPLTENGKVNKKMLTRLAGTLGHGGGSYVAPVTATERRLATVWAEVLGVPLERIGRRDNFFELGGTSLSAVRLVVGLDRLVSLKHLVAQPVLEDLAAFVDAREAPRTAADRRAATGLLQRLATPHAGPAATLIAFPYAGGNAVNFRQLATELTPWGVDVYAVELPGHDLGGADGEPMAEVVDIAKTVHDEIIERVTGPVLLWGHCAGVTYALEVARQLERSGRAPARLFAGALLLDDEEALRDEMAEVTAMSDRDITLLLRHDQAYVELDALKPERTGVVGAAYRHDVCSTNRYLLDALVGPAERVRTPMEVVVAADDTTTPGYPERHRDWERLAETVTLSELADGGHYFVRTRAAGTARLIAAAVPRSGAAPAEEDPA